MPNLVGPPLPSGRRRKCESISALCALALIVPTGARGCDRADFRIVLDVGHTERAPGATSARGATELSFNKRLAAAVSARLAREGFTSVTVLHGRFGGQVDLLDRAARADALHADALLSLHHDSVQPAYLQAWTAPDGSTRRYSDRFSGFSLFVSRLNRQPAQSLALARDISDELRGRGLHFSSHHAEPIRGENRPWADAARGIYAFDGLVVLKNTAAPAVLLESGLIVNRDEELVLASPERRVLVADALAAAFDAFCTTDGR